ncbi:hypothetical protein PAXRUDRAFT_18354 [Paxillus rubicundulus Ve08.2h10]|uniref:Uncharacterized protein n=1 Tax=Paxillus rubicundulus Ve08.2h10 TaxID=930991 RepID=A0A0D0DF25_9AGAM|nr:hypothetical protein PAXRUDRAFT_18354 [Paxillus rubicundulus Ve08.2h10]
MGMEMEAFLQEPVVILAQKVLLVLVLLFIIYFLAEQAVGKFTQIVLVRQVVHQDRGSVLEE